MSWGPGRKQIAVTAESLMKGLFTKCEKDRPMEKRMQHRGASDDGKQGEGGPAVAQAVVIAVGEGCPRGAGDFGRRGHSLAVG